MNKTFSKKKYKLQKKKMKGIQHSYLTENFKSKPQDILCDT